jgi:uncharacterized OsmC-like protein
MQGQKNLNGVNVDQLFNIIDRVKQNPDIAKFRFRARNKWIQGTHNRATTNGFYGAQGEDRSRDPMVFYLDEPPVLLGKNQGANPLEYLLLALSGCLTTSLIAHASAEQREELIRTAQRYSPVYNTLAQSALVSLQLDK